MASERASQGAFLGVSALLFSAAVTIVWCASMSAMGGMPNARRLGDVDGMDADARTDVARRRGLVPWHVGRDDAAVLGANAVALPQVRRHDRRDAARPADRTRGRGLLLRVDRVRNGRLSAGRRAGGDRDAAVVAGARRSDRGRCGRPDCRRAPVHAVEGASSRLLPGARPYGRPTPARPGDTACASASTAAAAVSV